MTQYGGKTMPPIRPYSTRIYIPDCSRNLSCHRSGQSCIFSINWQDRCTEEGSILRHRLLNQDPDTFRRTTIPADRRSWLKARRKSEEEIDYNHLPVIRWTMDPLQHHYQDCQRETVKTEASLHVTKGLIGAAVRGLGRIWLR